MKKTTTLESRSNSAYSPLLPSLLLSFPLNPGSCVVLTLIFNSSRLSSLHSEQIREAERRHRESFGFSSVCNLVFPLSSFNMRGFNKPLDTLYCTPSRSCQLLLVIHCMCDELLRMIRTKIISYAFLLWMESLEYKHKVLQGDFLFLPSNC